MLGVQRQWSYNVRKSSGIMRYWSHGSTSNAACRSFAARTATLPPQQRFPADRHQLLCATEPA
jgi:hypothetical protein